MLKRLWKVMNLGKNEHQIELNGQTVFISDAEIKLVRRIATWFAIGPLLPLFIVPWVPYSKLPGGSSLWSILGISTLTVLLSFSVCSAIGYWRYVMGYRRICKKEKQAQS